MTFSEHLDNNEEILVAMDKQCKPQLSKAAQLRNDILADYPELRRRLIELDTAYMNYADAMSEQHVIEAEKFFGKHS